MKELSAFKRIHLLKCCGIGSWITHFGLPRVKTQITQKTQLNKQKKIGFMA
jgi:hypothetical protein